ncbi:LysR family transcriptional regulator [Diaphorobacter caeni]|uniref:LysR family transcriptional regulator n=1 Tax=Diaphorobacter caeni TaxID=2784387 RepID=UPI0018902F7B|nr:LysR family transcriptional regulator [Diaphorobacter caeni]MBF5004311.1 LysR family transcriptional regulator [Diaphorobacter caeni]
MKPEILASLAAFEQVAQHRSLTYAAHALGVTPAALSQTIKKLETRLKVRLFDRTTRSVNLTEAGREYLERVTPALAHLREATEDLQFSAGVEGGTLRLTISHPAGRVLVEPMLAEFFALHPHIHLELVYDDGFVDIVRDGFDLGIRNGESLEGDMVAVRLTDEMVMSCAASPAYLRARGTPQHPDELARHHQCINYRMSSSGGIYKWEFVIDGKLTERAVHGPLTVNHWGTALQAARDGLGLLIGWRESLLPALTSGELVEVLIPYRSSFPGFYAYYPHRTHLPMKTRVFLDFLLRRVPDSA